VDRRSQQFKGGSALERPTLKLLGPTHLKASGGATEGLERKMAALLAFLALEGSTPRQKLAGLLWPEIPETSARNNLRQLLHRLRRSVGDGVLVLDDPLRLSEDVQVDVLELLEHARHGSAKEMLAVGGELLTNLEYDDSPDLAEWVWAERERLQGLRRRALEVELRRLEREGEYDTALQYAEALIEADPASEQTHRSLMRLHHLRGDRTAALRAFERCKAALELHLGLEPFPETLELAQEIEQGSIMPVVMQRRIPLSVLRPPVLAGREREWARLEAARQARLGIFISGAPGVGKSRLAMDFASARSQGQVFRLEGRPGDAEVPYSTYTRQMRQYLDLIRMERFEPWVRQELSRFIPELWTDPPPPITSDAEKLRLFEAATEVMIGLGAPFCLLIDDLHSSSW
jgi:DNA-binding SARP family transcriptional activator